MKFLEDSESLSGTRRTRDNYLIGFVKAGRTGIQHYSGAEVGSTKERVALYRPPEEVFSKDSLATLVGKPITVDHPWPAVDSSNWLQFARGHIGEGVLRDGEYIRIPISVMDEAAIKVVESGEKRELSLGYDADIDWTPGITDSNEPFDGVMRALRYNHLSIVDVARAGSQCRIGDEVIARPVNDKNVSTRSDSRITETKQTHNKMAVEPSPQKIYDINGVTIETIDQAFAFAKTKDSEISTLKQTIAARDSELAKRDSAIADLKKEVEQSKLTDEQIGEQVKARASLIADAQKIITAATGKASTAELHKLSPIAIKTAAVEAARGKSFVDGKSADYVSTAFDIVLADSANAKTKNDADDYSVFFDRQVDDNDDPDGQKAYEKRKEEAWKKRVA